MYNLNTPGKRLKTLREAADLSQEELATQTDLSQSIISLAESDRRKMTVDLARKLAKPLGTNPQYLLMLTDVYAPEVACVPA